MRIVLFALAVWFSVPRVPNLAAQQAPAGDSARAVTDSTRKKPFPLPPIVVTATMEPVRQDKVGFASSVVDHTTLAEPAPSAATALRRLPDVFIDEGAGPGGPTVLRIRGGEEPYTKVLWDGVPINVSGGFLDIQGLTLSNVERVEVTRGPQSALYGSSAMTGAVQFITRRGAIGGPVAEAAWDAGTATQYGETGRGEIALRGGVPKFLYSVGGATAYDRGIFLVAHNAWTEEGSMRLDATPSARLGITGIARYSDIKTNLPVRDPGATRVPLDSNQRDAHQRLTSSLTATFNAAPSWSHRLSLGILRDDFRYDDMSDGVTQPPDFFVADFTLTDKNTTRRTTIEYTGTNRLAAGPNGTPTFSYGGSLERETSGDHLTSVDFGNTSLDLARTSKALFGEVQSPLGANVSLLAGTRVEKFQGLPTQVTPRGSLVIALVPDRWLVRAAAGRSYKAPNLFQQFQDNPFTVPNPNLAPETAYSWEIGLAATPAGGPVRGSATYFRQEYRNLIRTVAADNDPRQTNKNLGKSRAEGVELELEYRPSNRAMLGANGSWIRTTVLENSGLDPSQYPIGEELPFRPHLIGGAHADWSAGRFTTSLRATLTGSQTVLTERFGGQRAAVTGYTLLGLTVSYDPSRAITCYVAGDNLLNTYYQTGFDRRGVPLRMRVGMRLTS